MIDAHVADGQRTLETGAGVSTVMFALKGAHHTAVVYHDGEIKRIRDWCAEQGISTERVEFVHGRSEELLPGMGSEPLDFVLIDGGHQFPVPFVDWLYAGRRLREGGHLIVDDVHIWTGQVLRGFLDEQPGWELVEDLPLRSALFRRVPGDSWLQEWGQQPYVARRSVSGGRRRAALAWSMLRRGQFRELGERVRGRGS
jgi:hypothetical protein